MPELTIAVGVERVAHCDVGASVPCLNCGRSFRLGRVVFGVRITTPAASWWLGSFGFDCCVNELLAGESNDAEFPIRDRHAEASSPDATGFSCHESGNESAGAV